jgi:folate-binding protein YgfZ
MNLTWQNFLTTQSFSNPVCNNVLYSIDHLGVLKVTGDDATAFLQGQLTCNIKELTQQNSFFAGFCNPKGRVISTLLLFKQNDEFLLILPLVLLDQIKNKLQRYILRSQVKIENGSDELCLSGLSCSKEMSSQLLLPEINFSRQNNLLKLPNNHYLLVADAAETIAFWSAQLKLGFQVQSSQVWQALDVNAGLAWLIESTSEQHTPQMLNLDKLGGISFSKGCYTGQEVVARTHYLGKVKRELFLAQTTIDAVFSNDNAVIDQTGQSVGQVLTCQIDNNSCKILVVLLTSAAESAELKLNNPQQDKITLIPFATA